MHLLGRINLILGLGNPLKEAARQAKKFAERALIGSMRMKKGVGPVSQARQAAERHRVLCGRYKLVGQERTKDRSIWSVDYGNKT